MRAHHPSLITHYLYFLPNIGDMQSKTNVRHLLKNRNDNDDTGNHV